MLTYSSWVAQKTKTALEIANGCCGGEYAEGALILCATISAMSALAWPGDGKDRKRFIEVITKFPPDTLDPTLISVPLLAQKDADWKQRLQLTEKAFYLTTKNDKTEKDVLNLYPQASNLMNNIRNYSYVNLLYKQIRCGFVHEYMTKGNATDLDQMRQISEMSTTQISYVNSQDNSGSIKRRIYFPLEWIAEVAKSVAQGLDCARAQRNTPIFHSLEFIEPNTWWIEPSGKDSTASNKSC